MKNTLFILCIFWSTAFFSQSTFFKTLDVGNHDVARDIISTWDEGFVILGQTNFFNTQDYDVLLIKTDAQGDTLGIRTFDGGGAEVGYGVIQTDDQGFLIVGEAADGSPGASNSSVFLVRTDDFGREVWSKKMFGGAGTQRAVALVRDLSGGYVFTGELQESGSHRNIFVAKIDEQGQLLWQKTYYRSFANSASGIIQTEDGGFLICGNAWNGENRKYDAHILKTDAKGILEWSKSYGGQETEGALGVRQTSDRGYIVAGHTASFGSGNQDVYLLKLNPAGDTTWTRTFGSVNYDIATDLLIDGVGNFIVTGYGQSTDRVGMNAYLLKVSAAGDSIWKQTLDRQKKDYSNAICYASDSSFRMAGVAFNQGAGSISDALMIKAIDPDAPPITKVKGISLYPNPNDGIFKIRSNAHINEVVLYDATGKMVYSSGEISQLMKVWNSADFTNLRAGLYIASVRTRGQQHTTSFIIK